MSEPLAMTPSTLSTLSALPTLRPGAAADPAGSHDPSPAREPAPAAAAVSADTFRQGMARLAGAVTVVTTDGPAGRAGFTASAVCSVTDRPPTVLVCMNRGSHAHPQFVENGVLCVNVLAGHQQSLSSLFADRTVAQAERFLRCAWQARATGAPGLDDALVQLDGSIVASHDVGSHRVFIVELRQLVLAGDESSQGLVYFDRGYHALGAGTRCDR